MSYARALLEWATASGFAKEAYAQSACLVQLMDENPSFAHLLSTPMVSITKKTNSVVAILKDCAPHLVSLVRLCIKNHREKQLKHIIGCFQKLYRDKMGVVKSHVELARKIDRSAQQTIENFIASRLKKDVEMDYVVNPDIIGGFIITIEDRLLDKSIRGELELLRKHLS